MVTSVLDTTVMSFSYHSRDSSVDEREQDNAYRDGDDMMVRKLAGNLPAPLRKKKTEETYKRFITPTGDPMSYVRQHMRSRSMSDIQVENAEKEQERDARNLRYEEMQELKVQLREEEDTWTSKLDNWKQRRRSATLDVRKRKEDRESIVQKKSSSSIRKPKTYREIVEDKKRRESGTFDDESDGYASSFFSNHTDQDNDEESSKQTRKLPYRGAVSVPDITRVGHNHVLSRSPSPGDTKVVVKPVKYTTKVTAVIDHVPTESEGSSDLNRTELPTHFSPRNKEPERGNSNLKSIWPPPPRETAPVKSYSPPVKSVSPPTKSVAAPLSFGRAYRAPVNNSRTRSQSPPPASNLSKASVVMRQKSPNTPRERPKSAYSSVGDRASTLPRNYHAYSAPKASSYSTSSFVQQRKTAFANKRNMWENKKNQEPEAPRAPQHLSSLLKHDTERLHGNDRYSEDKPTQNGFGGIYDNQDRHTPAKQTETYSAPFTASSWQRKEAESGQTPKNTTTNDSTENHNVRAPWLRSEQPGSQVDSKPAYKRVVAPQSRATWSKTSTLPAKVRVTPAEERVDLSRKQPEESSPTVNGGRLEPSETLTTVQKSPRSPSGTSDSLFDDMKICINQRPKSEKGFGFTVRGGDEGRPVIVNTVSPGLAADICQLCVGDEILAINDVRLSSSLTQDGIVQLIVDSVITGSLSLDIRRYGKLKKSNPLRLSGTKVVMTSGGFVQVRSDKGKAPIISTKTFNGNSSNNVNKESSSNESFSSEELPLPPPPENLNPPKKLSAMDRLSPKKTSPSAYKKTSPLSKLIGAAKSTSVRPQGKENSNGGRSAYNARSFSPEDYEDDLQFEVMKAQHDLEVEESYLKHERRQHAENVKLREQLLEEQRLMEEREAKREEEKRRRIEEAKAEELKVEEELRRIKAAKLEQQKRREEEKRRLMDGPTAAASRLHPTFNQSEMNHWLIEEAERSRLADEEGRHRMNALEYSRENNLDGALPDHVIRRLEQRNHPHRGVQSGNSNLPGTLRDHWNDPSTQATLL